MISGMLKVDEAIYESNKIICRQISRLGESTRGEVSQEVLESLRHFVEHIILKEYANGGDIEDTHENLKAAVKYVKNEPQLIHLSRFHHFLQVSSSHRVLKEHNAERLMIRYYEYLFRIRKFLYDKYSMVVLENLEQFPLDTNDELTEYYTKIATVVDRYNAPIHGGFRYDRFYVQKIKPFFINNKIYYEVAFVPANDNASKTDSIIAFTDMEITSYYAVKFAIADNSIEIFDQRMPIRVIVDWEVNIRPCELKNFNRILDNSLRDYGSAEQRNINDVRKMNGDIYYLLQTYGYSTDLDKSIFAPAREGEVVLCLNYGGLYGINNINHFLQESNTGKAIWRGIQRYKVGDPILFNDASDKFFTRTEEQLPVIHNNMTGRIVDFLLLNEGKATEGIQFDIEIDRPLIDMDMKDMDFTIVGTAANGNSIIRFVVNKNKTTDEDDEGPSKAIVPFQIAYAVSIHKAQGLEYDHVKIIITDEIDELITHSIFYTAITRARESLKIYWTQPVEEKVLDQIKPQDHQKDVALLRQEIK